MKVFLYIIVFLFAGMASASTVTLTGSCSSLIANSSGRYVNFTLSNTGNGPAANMFLTTNLHGLYSYNTSTLQILNPNQKHTFIFPIKNPVIYQGIYGFGVLVSYTQGIQNFSVSFPCLVTYANPTKSMLIINVSAQNNKINVSVANTAPYSMTATIYFINPPGFISPEMVRLNLSKKSSYSFDSVINQSMLSSAEIVNIGIITSYVYDNRSYSSLNLLSFSSSFNSSNSSSPIFYTEILIVAAILTFLSLIIISIIRNRKHPKEAELD